MFALWKKLRNRSAHHQENQAQMTLLTPTGHDRPALVEYEIEGLVATDIGCHRQVNEDRASFIKPDDEERLARKGVLMIVADGMGGHAAGEMASSLAVEIISRVYYETSLEARAALEKAFHQANHEIYRTAQQDHKLSGMGTTCTALALCQGLAFCAHIGDSRLYLVRGGEIYLMSEDHSAVMEMVRRGLMSLEAARHHADKNIILRALGTHPELKIAVWEQPFPVQPEDRFVLCSDGLYDLVEDEEIKQAVLSAELQTACRNLIALAKERGGHDNITVGLLRLAAADSLSAAPAPELSLSSSSQ
jgi:protein phosphatase